MTRARDLARYNDFSGTELILDADGDTSITADTDDTIHFKIAGSDKFTLDPSGNMTTSGTIPSSALTGDLPAISGASLTGIESFSYLTHSITTTTSNRSLSSSFVTHLTRSFTVPSGKNATLIATVGAYGMNEGSNGQVAARITVSGASSQTGTTIIGHRGTFSGYAGEMNITQAFRLTNSGSHTVNFQVKNQSGSVTMNSFANGIDYLHILVFQD
jgi:hypothetical protein